MTTILAIDDCPVVLGLLALGLEGAGYQVDTATSGLEGLAKLSNSEPALMLLDLHMPGLGGLDVLTAVKQHGMRPDLPVIVLTADDDDWALMEAHARGATGYLTKPFDTEQLAARVEDVIVGGRTLWMDDQTSLKANPAKAA